MVWVSRCKQLVPLLLFLLLPPRTSPSLYFYFYFYFFFCHHVPSLSFYLYHTSYIKHHASFIIQHTSYIQGRLVGMPLLTHCSVRRTHGIWKAQHAMVRHGTRLHSRAKSHRYRHGNAPNKTTGNPGRSYLLSLHWYSSLQIRRRPVIHKVRYNTGSATHRLAGCSGG